MDLLLLMECYTREESILHFLKYGVIPIFLYIIPGLIILISLIKLIRKKYSTKAFMKRMLIAVLIIIIALVSRIIISNKIKQYEENIDWVECWTES